MQHGNVSTIASEVFSDPTDIQTAGSTSYVADSGQNRISRVDIKTGLVSTLVQMETVELAGVLQAEVVAFTPADGFLCEGDGTTVTSCDSCAVQCRSPSAALNNRDPSADVWWNPQGHVANADDISVTLDLSSSTEVKAIVWASLGGTSNDPLTLKVEHADDVGGPWTEVSKGCNDLLVKCPSLTKR